MAQIPQPLFRDFNNNWVSLDYKHLATKDKGKEGQPIFLKDYELQPMSGSYGANGRPVFIQNGEFKAMDKTVGGGLNFCYMSNGNIVSSQASAGSAIQPIFLEQGQIKAFGGNAVGNQAKPMFLNSEGSFEAFNQTIGGAAQPLYMSNGTLTPINASRGSETRLMYLNQGTFYQSSSTVGSNTKPVYLNGGSVTASSHNLGGDFLFQGTRNVPNGGGKTYTFASGVDCTAYTAFIIAIEEFHNYAITSSTLVSAPWTGENIINFLNAGTTDIVFSSYSFTLTPTNSGLVLTSKQTCYTVNNGNAEIGNRFKWFRVKSIIGYCAG